MTNQTINTRSSLLTKEQRQQLRASWSKFIAEGKHKTRLVDISYGYGLSPVRTSRLSNAHHLLYNALTKENFLEGYTPISNPNKLANYPKWIGGKFFGLYTACWDLQRLARQAEQLETKSRSELRAGLEKLAYFWGNEVTEEEVDRAVLQQRARVELLQPFHDVLTPEIIKLAAHLIKQEVDLFLKQVHENG